ncbi:MAG: hypothetical protein ACHQ50_01450 [Fimbriimonadales bacterium]
MLWPIILTLVACTIFYAGWWVENRLVKAPWKWVALVPIGYGLWIGWNDYLGRWLGDSVYQSVVSAGAAKRMMAAHWAAFLIPLFGLAAIILFHFFNHKMNLPGEDD